MTLSLDTQSVLGSPGLGAMSPVGMSASPRNGLSNSHSRMYKHRRRPSNASTTSTSSPAVTQFPVFDPTYEYTQSTTYCDMAPRDPVPLFKQSRSDSFGQDKHGSSFSKKIKPLVKYTGTSTKGDKPLDLNLSKAENQERGAYIADSPPMTSDSAQGHNAYTNSRHHAHSRTMSGTSQISSSSAQSTHRIGTTYVHPARQAPHSPTPPVPASLFEPPGVLHHEPSHGSLTNVPSLPPPSHFRGVLRSQASTPTPTNPPTPALVPSAPPTARSSIDSTFRDRVSFSAARKSRRPSRNKGEPMDIEEEQLEVLRLRRKWEDRQTKKDEKYRMQDEKRVREEEKKARRKSEANEKSRRSQARQRGDSDGTMDTVRTFDSELTGRGRSKPNTRRGSNVQRPGASVEQLSAIGYASTSELGRPKMGRRTTTDDAVEEEALSEKAPIPKRQKTQGAASASKAAHSRWTLFWFQFKTVLMKVFRNKPGR